VSKISLFSLQSFLQTLEKVLDKFFTFE